MHVPHVCFNEGMDANLTTAQSGPPQGTRERKTPGTGGEVGNRALAGLAADARFDSSPAHIDTTNEEDTMYESKHRDVTYLGVPCQSWTFGAGTSDPRLGNRVVVTRWLADAVGQPTDWKAGDLVVSHVKGDGRTPKFVKYDTQVIPNGTDEQAREYAQERLS